MAKLKIFVVDTYHTFDKDHIDLDHKTVDEFIAELQHSGELPPPPDRAAGGGTIWKMTKSGKSDNPLGDSHPTPGFEDGDEAYFIAVPL